MTNSNYTTRKQSAVVAVVIVAQRALDRCGRRICIDGGNPPQWIQSFPTRPSPYLSGVPTQSLVPARLVTTRVELPVFGTSHVRPRGKTSCCREEKKKKARPDRDWWRCRVGNWREVDRKRDRAHTAFAYLRAAREWEGRETGTKKKKAGRRLKDRKPMTNRWPSGWRRRRRTLSTAEEVVRAQAR